MSVNPVNNNLGMPPIKSQSQAKAGAAGLVSAAGSGAIKSAEEIGLFGGLPADEAKFGRYELLEHYMPSVIRMIQEMKSSGTPEDQVLLNLKALGVISQ